MDIFKIIAIGIVTCITVIIVKQVKPEIAVILGIAGGIVIILMIVNSLTSVFSTFNTISEKTGLSSSLFYTVLKIVGIGYLTEFSANICNDAGSSGIADKILLGGKVLILVIAMPIVTSIIDIVIGLLP